MRVVRKPILLVILCTLLITVGVAEDKPRVSIVPFVHSIGVLDEDASSLAALFESALVRSGQYVVVKQSDLASILGAQEASLQDFADREYAVELGRIVSASHIFVGRVAKLGRTYVVDVQLVDVESGKALRAETTETTSAAGFLDVSAYLAQLFSGTQSRVEPLAEDYRIRMYLTIGDRFAALQRYEAAIGQYEKALELDEFNVDVLWRILTSMKEQMLTESLYSYDAASSGLDVALRSDYTSLRMVNRSEVEAALEKIYTIQAIDPLLGDDVALLLDEATVFKMDGRVADATQVLERALVIHPEDPFVLAELGLLRVFNTPEGWEAEAGFDLIRRAMQLSPQTSLFALYLGRSFERRDGRTSVEALRAYRTAAELARGPDFWVRRLGLYALQSMQRWFYQAGALEGGVLSETLDMPVQERLEHMEYLVENDVRFGSRTDTRNPDYYLASLYLATGRFSEAREAMRGLVGDDPDGWRRASKPQLELYVRILKSGRSNPELLEALQTRIDEMR